MPTRAALKQKVVSRRVSNMGLAGEGAYPRFVDTGVGPVWAD